jgi:prepilin-type N-terminal cleavage/methylation domain-containing protein
MNNKGFTLLELMVVITLISMMLFFAIPNFHGFGPDDDIKRTSRWLLLNIKLLKGKALKEQKEYILNISIESKLFWISNEDMSEEEKLVAKEKGFNVPESISVIDVEFTEDKKVSIGDAEIYFYKKGYSDKAIIHIEDEENNKISFVIEPFLSRVKMLDEYASFDE